MRIVGLTGNIAAGKSAVAQRLAALGAPIIDADQLARSAVERGSPGLHAIAQRFGGAVLQADGSLDRAALRRVVFANPIEREALNAIVHPEVARRRDRAVAEYRASGASIVICDIPLLFEVGLEATVDSIVLVDAPAEVRRARLIRDRGLSAREADAMIAAQLPSDSKRARAHFIIDNAGTLAELEARVDALWAALNE